VTTWDRISGGTTFILHAPPTTVPGTPAQPEYLKADVYMPPAFIANNPQSHRMIQNIVQQFIETVSVQTVRDWTDRARRVLGYSLTQRGNVKVNPRMPRIPKPQPHSSRYVFYGQPTHVPASPSSLDSFGFEEHFDEVSHQLVDMQEKVECLTAEKHDLEKALAIAYQRIKDLEEHLDRVPEFSPDPCPATPIRPSQRQPLSPAARPIASTPSRTRNLLSTPQARSNLQNLTPVTSPSRRRDSPGASRRLGTPSRVRFGAADTDGDTRQSIPMYDLFLKGHNLDNLTTAVKVAIRLCEHDSWATEFEHIGVPADLVGKLVSLVAFEMDI
jgi:hypothetical protein